MILNWKVRFYVHPMRVDSCIVDCSFSLVLYSGIGACGGELACSTCHLIFEQEFYDKLDEKEEEEDDMLDLAFEVTET